MGVGRSRYLDIRFRSNNCFNIALQMLKVYFQGARTVVVIHNGTRLSGNSLVVHDVARVALDF